MGRITTGAWASHCEPRLPRSRRWLSIESQQWVWWTCSHASSRRQSRLQAYRELARLHHPDKGGDAATFARILAAFQVLSDERQRAVYDVWARELEFRYVDGVAGRVRSGCTSSCLLPVALHALLCTQQICRVPVQRQCAASARAVTPPMRAGAESFVGQSSLTGPRPAACACAGERCGARAPDSSVWAQAEGGEGMLLDELRASGVHCDPLTQLVVTCEVCRRPSNKECWTCGMRICDFCTLKRHWKAPPCAAPDRAALCVPGSPLRGRAGSAAAPTELKQHSMFQSCRAASAHAFCVPQQSGYRRRRARTTLSLFSSSRPGAAARRAASRCTGR